MENLLLLVYTQIFQIPRLQFMEQLSYFTVSVRKKNNNIRIMGFLTVEDVPIQELGLTLGNLYHSLKGEVSILRHPDPTKYNLVASLYTYATPSAQHFLRQQKICVEFLRDEYPSNAIAMMYTYCKTLFPDITTVDM